MLARAGTAQTLVSTAAATAWRRRLPSRGTNDIQLPSLAASESRTQCDSSTLDAVSSFSSPSLALDRLVEKWPNLPGCSLVEWDSCGICSPPGHGIMGPASCGHGLPGKTICTMVILQGMGCPAHAGRGKGNQNHSPRRTVVWDFDESTGHRDAQRADFTRRHAFHFFLKRSGHVRSTLYGSRRFKAD